MEQTKIAAIPTLNEDMKKDCLITLMYFGGQTKATKTKKEKCNTNHVMSVQMREEEQVNDIEMKGCSC